MEVYKLIIELLNSIKGIEVLEKQRPKREISVKVEKDGISVLALIIPYIFKRYPLIRIYIFRKGYTEFVLIRPATDKRLSKWEVHHRKPKEELSEMLERNYDKIKECMETAVTSLLLKLAT